MRNETLRASVLAFSFLSSPPIDTSYHAKKLSRWASVIVHESWSLDERSFGLILFIIYGKLGCLKLSVAVKKLSTRSSGNLRI